MADYHDDNSVELDEGNVGRRVKPLMRNEDGSPDVLFLPKTVSSFLSDFVGAAKILSVDFAGNVIRDVNSVRENRGKGGINNIRLGILALNHGQVRMARFRFYLASKFSPKSALPHYYLAKCYIILGNYKKAILQMRIASYLKPQIKPRLRGLIDSIIITNPEFSSEFMKIGKKPTSSELQVITKHIGNTEKNIFIMIADKVSDFVFFLERLINRISSSYVEYKKSRSKKVPKKVKRKKQKTK